VAQALEALRRVDAQVVENLAISLAQCKRMEDKLGPGEVLDTVVAQHGLVRRLVAGGCPDNLVKPLKLVESNMASTIGISLINMGHPDTATGYFQRARKAGHDARNPAYAAYAATNASMAAFLLGDTPTALDTAAAARSLAARTHDVRLKALAEQTAAAACLLGKPRDAVEAASNAMARFDRTYVGSYGRCQVRLGHALVLSKEIAEAAHILGDAASLATHSPRLTAELHTVRTLMQPWENTHPVTTLDAQLEACGLGFASPADGGSDPAALPHRAF
jgi:tetratricopeptide (TPR) repeat protein